MKTLSDKDIARLKAQLKRYGIESPELLSELSDHYAEQMEERMAAGLSFEEAFAKFKRENSWLKLRKLEHKHAALHAQTVYRMLKAEVFQLFLGPAILFTYPALIFLIWLSGQELSVWKPYFIAFHVLTGSLAIAMMLYILFARMVKRRYFATLFQFSLWTFYLIAYLPLTADDYFGFGLLTNGAVGMRIGFTVLYSIIAITVFLFGKTSVWAFRQLRMDPNRA